MKKLSVFLCSMVMVFDVVGTANASLITIGTASYGGSDYNLIYEDDSIDGGLVWLDKIPKPSEAVLSSFIANFDAESCIGCGVCLDRCQMRAITDEGDGVALNADRCIGCGLCVSTCPSGALTLVRKSEGVQEIPDTLFETWRTIALDRANVKSS